VGVDDEESISLLPPDISDPLDVPGVNIEDHAEFLCSV